MNTVPRKPGGAALGRLLRARSFSGFRKLPSPPQGLEVAHVVVCFRHGDRTPSHNLFEPDPDAAVREALGWALELPSEQDKLELERYAPVSRSESSLRPRDVSLGVFGQLTARGLRQASSLGKWIKQQYLPHGNFPMPNQSAVACFSSNYSRTILTAQAVLKELLGASLYDGNKVRVQIASPNDEFINVYPFLPRLQKLMYDAANNETGEIASKDAAMAQVQHELVQTLPAFAFKLRRFSWISYQDYFHCRAGRMSSPNEVAAGYQERMLVSYIKDLPKASKDGLNAADVSRAIRRLSQYITEDDANVVFTNIDADGDGRVSLEEISNFARRGLPMLEPKAVEESLWGHCSAVENHVSDRFESWYSSSPILNQAVGRLLGTLSTKMSEGSQQYHAECEAAEARKTSGGGAGAKGVARFTLIAGHDVTLLPLLHGLGAWNKLEKQWPMYASSIVFEVLRCSDTKRRYVRAFYSNGSNEDSENDDIGMQEVVFGDSSGAHLLGEETQLMPFETFEKFCNFVSLDQS